MNVPALREHIEEAYPPQELFLPDCTLSMLEDLYRPLYQQLLAMGDLQAIATWLDTYVTSDSLIYQYYRLQTTGNHYSKLKLALQQVLGDEIVALVGQIVTYDGLVTPWDVSKAITAGPITYLTAPGNSLPVTIYLPNGKPMAVSLTEEQAAGILACARVLKANIALYMYQYPVDDSFLDLDGRYSNFTGQTQPNWQVYIISPTGYHDFYFTNLQFIQGFDSAAAWLGVNGRQYWTNARRITAANPSVEEPITLS